MRAAAQEEKAMGADVETCSECGCAGGEHRAPSTMPITGCSRYVPVGGDFSRRVAGGAWKDGHDKGVAEERARIADFIDKTADEDSPSVSLAYLASTIRAYGGSDR